MGTRSVPYRQGVHHAMTVLRGQWAVAVLATLALGERNYSDLVDAVNEVEERDGWTTHSKPLTERTLTDTLRRAQDDGLVERHAEGNGGGHFAGVRYTLTPKGRALLSAVRPLAEWSQKWGPRRSGEPDRQS